MNGAIETREVITVAVAGCTVRGTYHKPQSPASGDECRIGVLFVSWMWPRAGNGDSVVYWADVLAQSGYLTFRFNFPGMGDSDGDFSIPGLDIVGGGYRSALSSIADQLVERFRLQALVVVGHCDMAVNAVYAAADGKNIDGLILLDPYFHLPQPVKKGLLLRVHMQIVKALAWNRIAQPKLRAAGLELLAAIRRLYRRSSPNRLVISRKTLPANANLPLLGCWKQLTADRLPMLVLRSPNSTPKPGEFDYLAFLQRDSTAGDRVTVTDVERAGAVACTHAFMERAGKEIVRINAERWLRTYFASSGYGGTRDLRPEARTRDIPGLDFKMTPNSRALGPGCENSLTPLPFGRGSEAVAEPRPQGSGYRPGTIR